MSTSLVEWAEAFARQAHEGQFRQGEAKQPLADHAREVAELVKEAGGTDVMIAAAWLHDVVEDTETTIEQICELFGVEAAELVDGLTDPLAFRGLSIPEHKKLQAERVAQKSPEVQLIKLCDQIVNVRSVTHDPPITWSSKMCVEYARGAELIALVCGGTSKLLEEKFLASFHEAMKRWAE